MNALHPFRDGNGRAQRAFFAQIGAEAGYRIDWTAVDVDENVQASRASLSGDHEPLRALLERIVESA